LHRVTACTGRPGCASALADVRADALAVHATAGADAAPVHWSGCARRCGRPAGTAIDMIATGSGYQVHRAGTSVEAGSDPAALAGALRGDFPLAAAR
jgi:precorrin-3B synthase